MQTGEELPESGLPGKRAVLTEQMYQFVTTQCSAFVCGGLCMHVPRDGG